MVLRSVPIFLACLAVSNCGSSDTTTTPPSEETSDGGAGDTSNPSNNSGDGVGDGDGEVTEDITGTYALKGTLSIVSQVPMLGDLVALNTTYGIVKISASDDDGYTFEERDCRVISESDGPTSSEIPDRVPRSIPVAKSPLKVRQHQGELFFERNDTVTVLGINFDNPETDDMPTSASDPRIFDQDGDGNPGITILVAITGFIEGEIYVAQRRVSDYAGKLMQDGTLQGTIKEVRSEQLILGTTNQALAQEVPTHQSEDLNLSPIVLKRIEGDYDCDKLVNEIDRLFAP